ncbi:MAG: insulinase family protein [bacterium]|nr:insulinase family protein [bacterium]
MASSESIRRLSTRVRRVPGVPIVAARLWLWGGLRLERIPGQSLVTGRMLAEGTRERDWNRIAVEAEDRGMLIQTFGTHENLCVAVEALASDWRRALGWLAELALEPAFPEDRLDWIREQVSAELESLMDQPEAPASRAFLEQLYHPHAFARPLQGDRSSLGAMTPDDCAAFHRDALGWGGTLVVTGQIDEAAAEQCLDELFSGLAGVGTAPPEIAPPRGLDEPHREVAAGGADQAHLFAGHLTVPRDHPDLPALEVVGVVLGAGAGMSGRLPERIREREGLAYSSDVAVAAGSGREPGRLTAYAGTSPATLEQAEQAVREELVRLLEDGIEPAELEDARAYLIGRDPFRRETARQWANLLAEAELYGLPTDNPEWVVETLEALTLEGVEAAARRWIRPDELRVTVGLPPPESS